VKNRLIRGVNTLNQILLKFSVLPEHLYVSVTDADNRIEAVLTDLFIYGNDVYSEPLTSLKPLISENFWPFSGSYF